jgi:GNAT superfamily N-acetyltransferase
MSALRSPIHGDAGGPPVLLPWTVEPAASPDAPHLARLRWMFRTEVASSPMVVEESARFLVRCCDWMANELSAPGSWRAWCGWSGGQIVGTVWAQTVEKIPNPVAERELLGYISSVYVVPGHRGRGLGNALVEAAVEWCWESGCEEIVLWPTPASRAMYSELGFDPAVTVMGRARPSGYERKVRAAELSIQLGCRKVTP